MELTFYIIVFCSIVLPLANGANILVAFAMGSHSHFTLGFRLAKELADRGHNVTFISSYPQKNPIGNLTDISVEEIRKGLDEKKKHLFEMGQMSYLGQLKFITPVGFSYTENVLKVKAVQDLLRSNQKFDLVVLEHFMNEAMMIFAHKFNCPQIILAPGPTNIFHNYLLGNPSPASYIPNIIADFSSDMSLWERLKNLYYEVIGELFIHYVMLPGQNEILKRNVPGAPDLNDILYHSSLMLLISHVSLKDPVPLQPNIKEIGGYHVGPIKPLPKDLKEFLDSAEEGVILFSMGSNLKSAHFPKEKKDAIIKVLSRLKQKVLWKFEADLPEKPENVKIMSWIPQQDILAHPNVIAFITHVGLLGTIEAVYHGVPMLGLPVYWDQGKNIEDAARKGFALKIPFQDLNEQNFEWALNELVNNPKYRETAKLCSQIMHDQPVNQLDEAIFWIEYVIRHKGASHLRSAGLDLKWYQRYLVDIFLILGFLSGTFLLVVFYAYKLIWGVKRSKIENKAKAD